MKIVVSACLLGRNCKYNGGNNLNERVLEYIKDKDVIEVCPEVLAGLGTPRVPIEIVDGVIMSRDGRCVDGELREAVARILDELGDEEIECVILKSRSPTCGVKQVYDGTFSGVLVDGMGALAEALARAGYKVVDLGPDVSPERFVEAVRRYNADVLGGSALMTTTLAMQQRIVKEVHENGVNVYMLFGGAPCTREWVDEIGGDGYSRNAPEMTDLVNRLLCKN